MPPKDLNSGKRKGKINILNEKDISHWCKTLKCEREDLFHAVKAIGDSAKMVSDFLLLNRKKKE
jgi:hypothetical protein